MLLKLHTLDHKGQNVIEFSTVLLLVVVGITLMGPFVVRSVNSLFKGFSDEVQDSFNDPLMVVETNNVIPDCACEFRPPCDTPPCCGISPCDATEEKLVKVCDPVACEADEHQCLTNENCCTNPVPGECGVSADPTCPDGKRRYTWGCGETEYSECWDDPLCDFECTGETLGCHAKLCPNDDERLTENLCLKAVDECTDTRKCQFTCRGDFVKKGSGCGSYCDCPDGFHPAGGCNDHTCEPNTVCTESRARFFGRDEEKKCHPDYLEDSAMVSWQCVTSEDDSAIDDAGFCRYNQLECCKFGDWRLSDCQWRTRDEYTDLARGCDDLGDGHSWVMTGYDCLYGGGDCMEHRIRCCKIPNDMTLNNCQWSNTRFYRNTEPRCENFNRDVMVNYDCIREQGKCKFNRIKCCDIQFN